MRNIIVVASGTAAAQAITIISAPIITRLYGPEAFGAQGVFTSLAGILAAVAALTYPIAIVLPKSDSEARGIAALSVYIGILMSTVAGIALWLYGDSLLRIMNSTVIEEFIYLLPLYMFFTVLSAVLSQWLTRKHEFKLTAKLTVWQAIILNAFKVGGGLITPSASILIISTTFGNLLQACLFFLGIKGKKINSNEMPKQSISIVSIAKCYRDFPLLRAPQVFLNTLSQSFPVLMLATFSGPSAAAFYSIAIMALGIPANLIGNAVSQVFYPRFNEAVQNCENASKLLIQTTLAMALLGAPVLILTIFASPLAFSFIFGDEWRKAGDYAQWLAVWLFFGFINRPSLSAMPVLKIQGVLLVIEILGIAMRTLSIIYGFNIAKDENIAIALFSFSGVLLNIVIISAAVIIAKRIQPKHTS